MRRRAVISGFAAALAVFSALALPGFAFSMPFTGVVRNIKPSIVGVGFYAPLASPPARPLATGFAVGDGRHIITNSHVVRHAPKDAGENVRLVIFTGPRINEMRGARIVAAHPDVDLALLEIDGDPLPAVKLASTGPLLEDGADIAITGFPVTPVFGLYPATHRGTLAAVTPNVIAQMNARYLTPEVIRAPRILIYQLDIVAFPGNSGSPLYDPETGIVHGAVVSGIVKGTKENALTQPTGITFAIPAKYIRELLPKGP